MFDLWHFDNADDAVMQVKREPVSNGDEVRCCGFLWIASVASRL
jgi:hypothetical protein